MRSDNPLFGDRKNHLAWDWVDGPKEETKLASLLHFAERRATLPSPVFFVVPEGAAQGSDWQTVIAASEPLCECPSRRIIWPGRGRSRLLTRTSRGKNIKTITSDKKCQVRPGVSAAPIFLAPHGGDFASSFVMVTLAGGGIVVRQWPLRAQGGEMNVQYVWTPTTHAEPLAALYPPHAWNISLAAVDATLQRDGELVLMQRIPDPLMDGARVGVPLCSVISVVTDGNKAGEPPSFTLEVDGGIRTFTNLSDEDIKPHVCVFAL